MKLEVDEKLIVPEQNLEGKVAYVAKIIGVYPYNKEGTIKNAKKVSIDIINKSDISNSYSSQMVDAKDFKRFIKVYGVTLGDDLLGKPVISVYTTLDRMLTGLIPLNMDK